MYVSMYPFTEFFNKPFESYQKLLKRFGLRADTKITWAKNAGESYMIMEKVIDNLYLWWFD